MIADAPDHKGVYVLWGATLPLAVGHAMGGVDTIRSRLVSHLSRGTASGDVTHYSWQLCADPKARAVELERELGLTEERKPEAQDDERASHARPGDREPAPES